MTSFAPTDPSPELLDPDRLAALQARIAEIGADGWLLYDFRDQNPLAHHLLGLGKTTRRAFALFPVEAEPILLRHAIEASSWHAWPWESRTYAGWKELETELPRLLEGLDTVAMEISPKSAVPTVDRVPSGIVELVRATGVTPVTSGDLVSQYYARWHEGGLEAHRRAATVVRDVAHGAFQRAAQHAASGDPVSEAALMQWIEHALERGGVTEQVGCIAALGRTASDPHYHPQGEGERIESGSLVLIDLWGTEPGGIPADQTWMAWIGDSPDDRTIEVWTAVRDARDRALELLMARYAEGEEIRGWEVDRAARDLLDERGFGAWFVHRLGHSMDRELHGSGPNLDDLETRDERRILPGVGFSIEPGVYIPGEIGVRSEVNVYWGPDGPEVTPTEIQRELLILSGD
ncbi:MAG: aminopeptidase P family protein [Gemmatimonadales bacterium]|nr:MAG: aminopeptidase P family protein [Gemmatimonadales bacterium]